MNPSMFSVKTLETTGCIRRIEKLTRKHIFTIAGYSLDENISKGKFLESTIFNVGGNDWSIQYYPNGCLAADDDDDISIFLCLKSKLECVKAQYSFTILDQSGCASLLNKTAQITKFGTDTEWGYFSFAKRAFLEANIKDDCLIIQCVVSVFKVFQVEPTSQIVALPGDIQHQVIYVLENGNEAEGRSHVLDNVNEAEGQEHVLENENGTERPSHVLENGNKADVTFELDWQILSAPKCISDARSLVFSRQFSSSGKQQCKISRLLKRC